MRQCGDCQLCCKLLPVVELGKKAGERCQHQKHGKGCAIYPDRPLPCRLWSCCWLVEPGAAELRRPDRSHYVLDIVPDYIKATPEGGEQMVIPVIQVWVDPMHRDAYHDPALLGYINKRGESGCAAIIRWGSRDAVILFPPSMSSDGQWHEQGGEIEIRARDQREASILKLADAKP